jgi:hypothetical protein
MQRGQRVGGQLGAEPGGRVYDVGVLVVHEVQQPHSRTSIAHRHSQRGSIRRLCTFVTHAREDLKTPSDAHTLL